MFSTTKLSVVVAFLSFGLFATGCAASATDTTASNDSDLAVTPSQAVGSLESGVFNLYSEPNAAPAKACDVHTQLTFSNNGDSTHASLKDVVQGPCGIYVVPNVREYDLKVASNACGSITFDGQTTVAGTVHHIAITDNRKSNCADQAESPVVVDEYTVAGAVTTSYAAQ